jgi:hypothetical protein
MTTYQSAAVISGVMPDYARAGGVLNRYGTYTPAAALAEGSTIEMVPIPKNARIIQINILLASHDCIGTYDVGDGDDGDRFMDGIAAVTGGAAQVFDLFADGSTAGINYKYTSQDTIDIVVKESLLSAKTRLDMTVQYTMCGTIADET